MSSYPSRDEGEESERKDIREAQGHFNVGPHAVCGVTRATWKQSGKRKGRKNSPFLLKK